jgi:predicted dehydrogenase
MVAVCEREGVQLTIDHQRRFARPVTEAKRLLDRGEVGSVRRVEWSEVNLFDAGSHLFDLCDYLLDGERPAWALAGVDPDPDNEWFGTLNARRAVAQWGYEDGTQGLASTAESGETAVDAYLRVVGEDGVIEIAPDDGPQLRLQRGGGWRTVGTGGESIFGPGLTRFEAGTNKLADLLPGASPPNDPGPTHYERAIEHLVTALREGTDPLIAGHRVLRGTELVFACWASARRRERVELPLSVEGNPLEALCAEKFGTGDGADGDADASESRAAAGETHEPRADGDGERPAN